MTPAESATLGTPLTLPCGLVDLIDPHLSSVAADPDHLINLAVAK